MTLYRVDGLDACQGGEKIDRLVPVSDADLASLGYVKLRGGIDVEALRHHADVYRECKATGYRFGHDDGPEELYQLAVQVLAALDPQEDTT